MKGIVIYKSKYGATKQYAQWLASKLGFQLSKADEVTAHSLNGVDVVILGSSVYIGKLLIKPWIEQYAEILKRKKLFLFIVCGTPASDKQKTGAIVAKNLPGELVEKCQVFFLKGSLHLERLSLLDKFALRMGANFEKDPVLKQRMLKGYDEVKEENLNPLLESLQELLVVKA